MDRIEPNDPIEMKLYFNKQLIAGTVFIDYRSVLSIQRSSSCKNGLI